MVLYDYLYFYSTYYNFTLFIYFSTFVGRVGPHLTIKGLFQVVLRGQYLVPRIELRFNNAKQEIFLLLSLSNLWLFILFCFVLFIILFPSPYYSLLLLMHWLGIVHTSICGAYALRCGTFWEVFWCSNACLVSSEVCTFVLWFMTYILGLIMGQGAALQCLWVSHVLQFWLWWSHLFQ